MKHILSVDQFSKDFLAQIFNMADSLKMGKTHIDLPLRGKVIANLFYEPSTRTATSFHSAVVRSGGSVISLTDISCMSVAKGETLEDTIKTISSYVDAIVFRHPETGAAQRASNVSNVPIINAGDGRGEHPSQTLIDLYTINDEIGLNKEMVVALVGDLKNGRTVHSLVKMLRLFPNIKIVYVPSKCKANGISLGMPDEYMRSGDVVCETIEDVIGYADVIYMTRLQRERISPSIANLPDSEFTNNILTLDMMKKVKNDMIIMHPFPRINELPVELDDDKRAAYFRQIRNGLFIRMALLQSIFANNYNTINSVGHYGM